jgi:hypothetical protein
MHDAEETCGQELAASAEIPAAIGALLRHVSFNLLDHARAVGKATNAAAEEHDALLRVAAGYGEIADAAERTAKFMQTLKDLPAVPHDAAAIDRSEFVAWMTKKIDFQRRLAALLLEHADQSAKVLGRS